MSSTTVRKADVAPLCPLLWGHGGPSACSRGFRPTTFARFFEDMVPLSPSRARQRCVFCQFSFTQKRSCAAVQTALETVCSSALSLRFQPFGASTTPFSSPRSMALAFHNALFSPRSMAFGLPQRPFSVLKAWLWVFHNALFSPRSMALGLQVHMDWTVKAGGLRCKRPALVSQKHGGWRPQEAECCVCLRNLLDISAL